MRECVLELLRTVKFELISHPEIIAELSSLRLSLLWTSTLRVGVHLLLLAVNEVMFYCRCVRLLVCQDYSESCGRLFTKYLDGVDLSWTR